MTNQICLNEMDFKQLEQQVLNQIMEVSKSMIESFKFKLIYGTKVSTEQSQQTLKALQDFRAKHWDNSVSRKEAYKKYVDLYN